MIPVVSLLFGSDATNDGALSNAPHAGGVELQKVGLLQTLTLQSIKKRPYPEHAQSAPSPSMQLVNNNGSVPTLVPFEGVGEFGTGNRNQTRCGQRGKLPKLV